MATLTETLADNISAFGLWLSGAAHHLASFGVCMIVFAAVYLVGHIVGDSAGSARTEASFKECGKAHCWSEISLFEEPVR
jgi:hypothetical protein